MAFLPPSTTPVTVIGHLLLSLRIYITIASQGLGKDQGCASLPSFPARLICGACSRAVGLSLRALLPSAGFTRCPGC